MPIHDSFPMHKHFVNHHHETEYEILRTSIVKHFADLGNEPLYTTSVENLFDLFLIGLPIEDQQYYNCHACRDFINKYGSLVIINTDGILIPAILDVDGVPRVFITSFIEMFHAVASAKITGVFVARENVFGKPVTGEWTHFYVNNNKPYLNAIKSPYQYMAEKQADYKLLVESLHKYPVEAVEQAVKLLKTDVLYRSERILGVAEWLLNLHNQITQHKTRYNNLVWRAVATAPAGWCHVGSSMIGTLLDDIVIGMDYNQIAIRFASKMHPLQYQRPQVAPALGNIKRAKEIVAKLGLAPSLERRFACLDEVVLLWEPWDNVYSILNESTGVFAGITPKQKIQPRNDVTDIATPAVNITWSKFERTVLPDAKRISFKVRAGINENYAGTVTAVHADAPPIMQWDLHENRNPMTQYVYHGGSPGSRWNLTSGWHDIIGAMLHPSLWDANYHGHKINTVTFIIPGCIDTENRTSAIFPENLKAELHEVRATIEAYSKIHPLAGAREASACGIRFENNTVDLRVETNLGVSMYRIDRWD